MTGEFLGGTIFGAAVAAFAFAIFILRLAGWWHRR